MTPPAADPLAELRAVVARRLGLEVTEAQGDRLRLALAAAEAATGLPPGQVAAGLLHRHWGEPAWQAAISELTVQETCFMRHRPWLDRIAQVVRAQIAPRGERTLRVWSAACATGEEAWSLAMLGRQVVDDTGGGTVDVTATDLSTRALAAARKGCYGAWTMRDLLPVERARWFRPDGRRWQVGPDLRAMVRFAPFNLAQPEDPHAPFPRGPFDLIVCRNVLMYLTPAARTLAIRHLLAALAPGGILAVSPAEAVAAWYRPLTPLSFPEAILFQRDVAAPIPAAPPAAAVQPPVAPVAPGPVVSRPIAARPSASPPPDLQAIRALGDQGMLDAARLALAPLAAGDNLDANLLLAMICSEAGALDEGMAAARRAVYLAPGSAAAQFAQGLLQARRGATTRARRNLDGVLALLEGEADETMLCAVLDLDAGTIRQAARRLLNELAGDDRGAGMATDAA
ncbi:CheR family methyltransferase [Zavarzinia sp. CC-PAN008]|uniref:CheR family methyltransferase n=1 Tax=Zavarzinia sp. CC-PAN008 TaxID=3243332 RepID=UPI003F744AB6